MAGRYGSPTRRAGLPDLGWATLANISIARYQTLGSTQLLRSLEGGPRDAALANDGEKGADRQLGMIGTGTVTVCMTTWLARRLTSRKPCC